MQTSDSAAYNLFSVSGVKVGVHKSFVLVVIFLFVWHGTLQERILLAGMLFGSILIHEIAHALAGLVVGDKPKSIVLSFWGGLTTFQKPLMSNGMGAFVASAGPLANVLLVVCAALSAMVLCSNGNIWAWLNYFVYDFFDLEMTKVSLPVGINMWHCGELMVGIPVEKWDLLCYFKTLAVLNGFLAVFNLAPAYPLDGGRIFRCLSGFVMGRQCAAVVTMVVGRMLAVVFSCWCIYHDLICEHDIMNFIIGCYIAWIVWHGCYGEYVRTKIFVGAENSDPESEYTLGIFYLKGIAVEENLETAISWISKSADHGFAPAQYCMSLAYATGDGVVKDENRAFDLASKAASQDLPEGMCALARFYSEGVGCEADECKACNLYLAAAEKDSPEGQYQAALCFESGNGVRQDLDKAAKLHEKAFRHGYVSAAVELSLMYEYHVLESENGQVPTQYNALINKMGHDAVAEYNERRKFFELICDGAGNTNELEEAK